MTEDDSKARVFPRFAEKLLSYCNPHPLSAIGEASRCFPALDDPLLCFDMNRCLSDIVDRDLVYNPTE